MAIARKRETINNHDLARAYALVIELKQIVRGSEFEACNAVLNEIADLLLAFVKSPSTPAPRTWDRNTRGMT